MRPILAYASPVWGYAAETNINILDTLQNSLIRMIVKATRYMRNDDIRQPIGVTAHCTQHPIREQTLSSQSSQKNSENFPPRRSAIATPPGFHRSTNRCHATQQKGKPHSRHAPHQRLVMIWN
ncbi:hypothetical protein TNCV_4259001 [Trichonephila clavipes]|nr:hypothetical protein TNCV_4259001 [Trichonephila clavipes]